MAGLSIPVPTSFPTGLPTDAPGGSSAAADTTSASPDTSTTTTPATSTTTTQTTSSTTTTSTSSSSTSTSTASTTSTPSTSTSTSTSSSTSTSTPSTSASAATSLLPTSATATPVTSASTSVFMFTTDGQTETSTIVVGLTNTLSATASHTVVPSKNTTFFHNTAAVAGTFSAVGLVGLVLLAYLLTAAVRKRRARMFDEEVDEAAKQAYQEAEANKRTADYLDDDYAGGYRGGYGAGGGYTDYAGGYASTDRLQNAGQQAYGQDGRMYGGDGFSSSGYGDQFSDYTSTTQGTLAQQPMAVNSENGYESYNMHELNPSGNPAPTFDPYNAYGAAGAAGVGAGAALARSKSGHGPAMIPSSVQAGAPAHGFGGIPQDLISAAFGDMNSTAATTLTRGASQHARLGRQKSGKSSLMDPAMSGYPPARAPSPGAAVGLARAPSNPLEARVRRQSNPGSLFAPVPGVQDSSATAQESYASHYATDSQHPAATRSRPNSLVLDAQLTQAQGAALDPLIPLGRGSDDQGNAMPSPGSRGSGEEHDELEGRSNLDMDFPTPGYGGFQDPSRMSVQDTEDYGFGSGNRVLRVANE